MISNLTDNSFKYRFYLEKVIKYTKIADFLPPQTELLRKIREMSIEKLLSNELY